MKIGLLDVDGHRFPNLAQMKISSYHKSVGDDVERYDAFSHYDKVYVSKVFGFTPDYQYYINGDEIVKGGTGYAFSKGGEDFAKPMDEPLPYHIEHAMPDYSLYNIENMAYGFLTRGCPRGCDFCIVKKKEGGKAVKVAELEEFWTGQKTIVLLDPNILACKERGELLHSLAKSGAWVDFTQGLDVRLVDEGVCEALKDIKTKEIHFAWDKYEDKDAIIPKFELFARNTKINPHNRIVYVLTNHGTTIQQDLERIYTLRELGFWAYVMIYDKKHAPKELIKMQRWCNNRIIFSKIDNFDQYKKLKI